MRDFFYCHTQRYHDFLYQGNKYFNWTALRLASNFGNKLSIHTLTHLNTGVMPIVP